MSNSPTTVALHQDIWALVFDELQSMNREEAGSALRQEIVKAHKTASDENRPWEAPDEKEETHEPLTAEFQQWLREVRGLSRAFYIAATPHAYRIIDLTKGNRLANLDYMDRLAGGRIKIRIQTYTHRLLVPVEQEFLAAAVSLVGYCKFLLILVWKIEDLKQVNGLNTSLTAQRFLRAFIQNSRYCELWFKGRFCIARKIHPASIDDGYLNYSEEAQYAILPHQFESPGSFEGPRIKGSAYHDYDSRLAQHPKLEGFVPSEETFPPMTKLAVDHLFFRWLESRENILAIWDFSRLEAFRCFCTESDLINLLSSFTHEVMRRLRTLGFELKKTDLNQKALVPQVRALFQELFTMMKSIKVFKLASFRYKDLLPISTVVLAGTTLIELQLLDRPRYGDPLSIQDLKDIRDRCPRLRKFSFDLPVFLHPEDMSGWPAGLASEAEEALQVLATFRELEILEMHTTLSLGTADMNLATSTDPDYDDAEAIMRNIHASKVGQPFKSIAIILTSARIPVAWAKASVPDWDPTKRYVLGIPRVFCSRVNANGLYEQWVYRGPDRFGEYQAPLPDLVETSE